MIALASGCERRDDLNDGTTIEACARPRGTAARLSFTRDMTDPAAELDIDYDRDPRTGRRDIGADEVSP